MDVEAQQLAEKILAPLRGEHLEHEVYTVLVRRVGDVVAQAVKEREQYKMWFEEERLSRGQERDDAERYAAGQAEEAACEDGECSQLDRVRELEQVVNEQAEEIARLQQRARAERERCLRPPADCGLPQP